MAHSVWTGGSRHPGRAALPHKNIQYSTVLYQAYSCRKHIVIDDITSEQEYKKLREQKYIMLNKEHLLLSKELIEKGVSY